MAKKQQRWPADQVERRAVADLVPYARNSRTHTDEQIASVMASIREWGWTTPVLIAEDSTIIAGHARVMAAQRLKLEEVPVMVAAGWTEAQRRAYVIADNQLAIGGAGWDEELLRVELGEINGEGFDLDLLGFDAGELAELMGDAGSGDEGDGASLDDDTYSRKIEAPIYEITGDCPPVSALLDRAKADTLIAEIDRADIPQEVAAFLRHAAERHVVFNFRNIAEFYAHAETDVQDLMERSALVIIDFNRAIEEGFVKLSEAVASQYAQDYPDA